MRNKAVQRDANEPTIVAAIRSLGWLVQTLSGEGVPDLLVWTGARLILVEVKDGRKVPSERRLTKAQVAWHDQWLPAPIYIITSVVDVVAMSAAEAGVGA